MPPSSAPASRALVARLAVSLLLASSGARAGDLERDLRGLVGRANLGKATVSVSVRDVATGRSLADLRADRPMLPASNMKLATTAAALDSLGPSFRFSTPLAFDEATATLIVRGSGDPGFGDPPLLETTVHRRPDGSIAKGLDAEALLGIWAEAVANAGVRRVDELVVDDRVFDRDRIHPQWPEDQLNRHYCAEVAGVNFHANCLHLRPSPIEGRAVPGPFVPDAPWIPLENRATGRTGSKAEQTVWVGHGSRIHGPDGLTLFGNVEATPHEAIRVTVRDPAIFLGRLLAERLRRRGVDVGTVRHALEGESFEGLPNAAPPVETPLETVLARANVDSSNLHAEALLKRIAHAETGRPGSWSGGAAAVRTLLARRTSSELLEGVEISDGSGLSRGNRLRADLMTTLLASLAVDRTVGEAFLRSLAVAGESGTLATRFRSSDLAGCRVRAKTGYIRGVSCLSGLVESPDGRRLAFSILCNDVRSVRDAKRLQERIVERLARELAASKVG